MLKSKLLNNIISLFTLKGVEYIISFITLPYLLRVLGPEKYGAINFAQAMINYGILLVNYGFSLTAPRDIAKAGKDSLPRHFSAIMGAKLVLLLPVIFVGTLLVMLFRDSIDAYLLACMLPMLLGNVIFPVWYFQGIQQMKFITVFNLIARIVSVAGIFSLVQTSGDYGLAAFLQSFTPLLAGIISLAVLAKRNPALFCLPSWMEIKAKLCDGWDIFVSTLFINLYTNSNVFILGIMTNDTVVGHYAAASKLIEAVKGLLAPISNAIFPHISVLYKESKDKAVRFLCRMTRWVGGASFAISLIVFVFAEEIVPLIMGSAYGESVLLLRIISFLPFIIGLSNIFGVQAMVAFGMQRVFSRILMASAVVNFVLVLPMIYLWQDVGLSITVVVVEICVTVSMYAVLRKNQIIIR